MANADAPKASRNPTNVLWSNIAAVAAIIAAAFARQGLSASWRVATGKKPPTNPSNPDTDVKEALLWAALSGMVFAISRTLATRRAASYMARSKAPSKAPKSANSPTPGT